MEKNNNTDFLIYTPNGKKKMYGTIEDVKRLENGLGFLQSYKTIKGTYDFIGKNINTEDKVATKYLQELGKLNIRREELIKLLMNYKSK